MSALELNAVDNEVSSSDTSGTNLPLSIARPKAVFVSDISGTNSPLSISRLKAALVSNPWTSCFQCIILAKIKSLLGPSYSPLVSRTARSK